MKRIPHDNMRPNAPLEQCENCGEEFPCRGECYCPECEAWFAYKQDEELEDET